MFFNMELLCHRQGKFALIWYAATNGIRSIKNEDLQGVDVVHICDEIVKYLAEKSTSATKRLSLYLSAKLVYGAVLIYKQQVISFESQIVTFMITIKRPLYQLFPTEETVDAPKRKRTGGKRKTKSEHEPAKLPTITLEEELVKELEIITQQMLKTLPDVNQNTRDAIHITLQEEISRTIITGNQDLFGDEGQIDLQLAQFEPVWPMLDANVPISAPAKIQEIAPPGLETALPAPETPTKTDQKRKALSPNLNEQSPTKRKKSARIEALQHVIPSVQVQEQCTLSPQTPLAERLARNRQQRMEIQDEVEQPADRPLFICAPILAQDAEAAVADVAPVILPPPEETAQLTPTRPKRRLRGPHTQPGLSHMNISTPTKWKRLQYDRSDMDMLPTIIPSRIRQHDSKDIIANLLAGLKYSDEDIISIVRDVRENTSIDSGPGELTTVQDLHAKTLEPVQEQRAEISLHTTVVQPQQLDVHDELRPEMPPGPSPRLSRIPLALEMSPIPVPPQELGQIEPELKDRQTEHDEVAPPAARLHTSTPITFDTESKRHNALLRQIRNLFRNNKGQPLRIEQLCFPLNRLKIARTFFDLLFLQTKQYIKMVSLPDSVELDVIKEGPHLWEM